MAEQHDTHHVVSNERFEELKEQYCRRCGIRLEPGVVHEHTVESRRD